MYQTTIYIKGMHCRACELLVEEELQAVRGVQRVVANQHKGVAQVYHRKQRLDQDALARAVQAAGYDIGKDDPKPLLSRNVQDYKDLAIAFLGVAVLAFAANRLGLFNLTFSSGGSFASLPVVLLVGLTAGFSTCMALVGGLVLGVSARYSEDHPEATPIEKFRPHLLFNLSRIVSFIILGGVIGWVGSLFQPSALTLGIMTILVALVMLLLGLQLIGIFPRLSRFSLTLPTGVGRFLGLQSRSGQAYSHRGAILLGALTFFVPCGFTQAMQLFAISSGSALVGAATMGVFALGTTPGLLGIGGLTSAVRGVFARRFFKFAGVVVIFLALFNLSNGYNLTGWNATPAVSANPSAAAVANDPNVSLQDGAQVVRMTQRTFGYEPAAFTVRKGIPVRWVIDATDTSSCSSTIVSAPLGVRKTLQPGENVVEFTPTQAGSFRFTCIMGMYSGTFHVVDGGGAVAPAAGPSAADAPLTLGKLRPQGQGAGVNPGGSVQLVKTTYTLAGDIQPAEFTVKAGSPVRFEVDVKENGRGCMSTIMIPGLTDRPVLLRKGQPVVFDFTPTQKGRYEITCAMGVPRGTFTVE